MRAAIQAGEEGENSILVDKNTSRNKNPENDPSAMTNSKRPLHTYPTTKPARKLPPNQSSSPAQSNQASQLLPLQKYHSNLVLQRTHLLHSLDTAQQALKISSSTTDTELLTLITKWKLASREAAKEVFRGAKDRVDCMGGVGAWRELSRKKPRGWDDEAEQPGLDGMSEEQKQQVEIQREEMEDERRKYAGEQGEVEEEEEVVEETDDDVSTTDLQFSPGVANLSDMMR